MVRKKLKVMSELAGARERVYQFLASVYLETPSDSLLERLKDASLWEAVSNIPGLPRGCCSPVADCSIDDLKQEYMDLFMVPASNYVAPYEAVYCDGRVVGAKVRKGLLYGKSTVAVERFYKMAGAEIGGKAKDLPDHIGLELAFMAFMCRRERQAWEAGDEALAKSLRSWQRAFLESHPARWSEDLACAIQKKTENGFYRWAGRFTQDFVAADLQSLKED